MDPSNEYLLSKLWIQSDIVSELPLTSATSEVWFKPRFEQLGPCLKVRFLTCFLQVWLINVIGGPLPASALFLICNIVCC